MATNYTLETFWKTRLPISANKALSLVPGWSYEATGFPSFKEAPLTRNDALSADENPHDANVLLISAPGAVGKSTLAKETAFITGAVYIDLAISDPVGGNSISGGLAKSGLYPDWQADKIAVLIDGLDEARLRVTQEAFEAFLADIAQISANRKIPTVLFGRTGAIQDAWLVLDSFKAKMAVLEIGYYDAISSTEFAVARLRAMRPESVHAEVEKKVIEQLLARLRDQTENDGDRFAGYAPVLQAVAERVSREQNAAQLLAQIEKGAQPVTLETVVTAILDRERGKLGNLKFEDASLSEKLYLPEEQLDRLVAQVYHLPQPLPIPMSPQDTKTYLAALQTWVGEHPFLDGNNAPSSAVFEAAISVKALKSAAASDAAAARELKRGAAANPFLSEFYLPQLEPHQTLHIPLDHIGIVYSSLRARLSLGDSANLSVEGLENEEGDDEKLLKAEVEIAIARRNLDRPRLLAFSTEQTGTLKLGSYVEDVDITAAFSNVEIGPGPEAVLVAPINIQCGELTITAEKVIAERAPGQSGAAVYLEAASFKGENVTTVPTVNGDVRLDVSWPTSQVHPWTSFSTSPSPTKDPRLDEALRRFRKFIISFRSHSKGSLRRFKPKLEHERMTKGTGRAVLDYLLKKNIITLSDNMYELNPDKLGSEAGATYAEAMARRFSPKTVEFVKNAIGAK